MTHNPAIILFNRVLRADLLETAFAKYAAYVVKTDQQATTTFQKLFNAVIHEWPTNNE